MNITEIKTQFPEAFKAIFDEGSTSGFKAGYGKGAGDWCGIGQLAGAEASAQAERDRIAGIQLAAFPGQEAIIAECIKDGSTLVDAIMKLNGAYKATLDQHLDKFHADGTPIVPGVTDNLDTGKPPEKKTKDFEALVSEHMETNKCSKGDAIQAIAHANPAAHAAYIQAMNKGGE